MKKHSGWLMQKRLLTSSLQDMEIKNLKDKLKNYDEDLDKEDRVSKHLCKYCFYIKTPAGYQAITYKTCSQCDKHMSFSSTYTDLLCEDCAKETNSCKHCSGKQD